MRKKPAFQSGATVTINDRLRRLLSPQWDEHALFLMSFTFILLLMADPGLRGFVFGFYSLKPDIGAYALLIFFLFGMIFSIYHVFTTRPKYVLEKAAMLFFAVMISAFSGIYAGISMMQSTTGGWLVVFPVLNITNGVFLLIALKSGFIDESNVKDDDTPPLRVGAGVLAVAAITAVCLLYFHLNWAITFSICVTYASSLNRLSQSVLPSTLLGEAQNE